MKNKMQLVSLWLLVLLASIVHISISSFTVGQNIRNLSMASSTQNVVKIGLLYPATGDLSHLADGILSGAHAAIYRTNLLYRGLQFQLILANSASGSRTILTEEVQRLASEGVSILLVGVDPTASVVSYDIMKALNVPIISYADVSTSLAVIDDKNLIFSVIADAALLGTALAEFTVEQGNCSGMLVLNRDDTHGNSVADAFITHLQELGSDVALQIEYDVEEMSARTFEQELALVEAQSASCVATISFTPDLERILTLAQVKNINKSWIIHDAAFLQPLLKNEQLTSYLENQVLGLRPYSAFSSTNSSMQEMFLEDLQAVNGSLPTSDHLVHEGPYSDFVHDAVLLAAAAVNHSAVTGTSDLRKSLYAVTTGSGFQGLTGLKLFDCDGKPIDQRYEFWRTQEGKLIMLGQKEIHSSNKPCLNPELNDSETSSAIPSLTWEQVFIIILTTSVVRAVHLEGNRWQKRKGMESTK